MWLAQCQSFEVEVVLGKQHSAVCFQPTHLTLCHTPSFNGSCCCYTGKTVVQKGGSCVKADGSYDISKQCVSSAPVCMSPGSGTCVTFAESQAKPTAPAPAPTPAAPACASFSNLGGPCDSSRSICCGELRGVARKRKLWSD